MGEFLFLCAVTSSLPACSNSSGDDVDPGPSGAGDLGGIIVTTGPGGGDGGVLFGGNACIAEPLKGETVPVDIYIMFDQSGSMATPVGSGTRLDAVRAATANFLRSPDSRGLGVGIGYFGHQPIGSTSCDPAVYANASVPIAELPGNAQAILDSLNARAPTGETPTGAAIRGACGYAESYHQSQVGHVVSILLVTDGVPEAPVSMSSGCTPTLPDAVAAATACGTGSPGIKTYVLGVGPSLQNLLEIAQAGGTEKAYLVEGGNVSEQVLAALNQIRLAAAIPCELKIPTPPMGKNIDYNLVNLLYIDATGRRTALYNVVDAGGCGQNGDGWYYDNPAAPQRIVLCPNTCNIVRYEKGGELDYALGCTTIVRPR